MNIKLEVSKPEPIEINGEIYPVYKNALEVMKILEKIKTAETPNYTDLANHIISYIDLILGNGAFIKISGGQSVSYYDLGVWFNVICQTIIQSETEKAGKLKEAAAKIINAKYE